MEIFLCRLRSTHSLMIYAELDRFGYDCEVVSLGGCINSMGNSK